MYEVLSAVFAIVVGTVMLRYWRDMARLSSGPGLRGPGTTLYPAVIVRWFGYGIRGVGALFVIGGIGQIIAVLVT